MPDYSQTKAYQILCDVDTRVYVGHTTRTLEQRMRNHVNDDTHFSRIMKDIGVEHFGIFLLEARDCANVTEAKQLEHEWMQELCTLDPSFGFNVQHPIQELTEYEQQKRYREANKEIIRERKRKYVEENADYVAAKKAEWQAANRDKINQQRADNAEKVRAQRRASYHRMREADPEKMAAKQRAAYDRRVAKDPEAVRAYGRQAYHRNKAKDAPNSSPTSPN